jgi:hypothetical protein
MINSTLLMSFDVGKSRIQYPGCSGLSRALFSMTLFIKPTRINLKGVCNSTLTQNVVVDLQPNIAARDSNTTWTNITRVLFLFKIYIIQ